MKIKLAILDTDQNYLNRITSIFTGRFADKLEVYSFTSQELALSRLQSIRIHVMLATTAFQIQPEALPRHCAFAWLVESNDIGSFNGSSAICKFQRVEQIYKQILGLYAEKAELMGSTPLSNGEQGVTLAFMPASGGVGASTMAAACGVHFARQGKKVLYLNLEAYGGADSYFQGEGRYTLSDVIYALKSRTVNLALTLESSVRQSTSGVFFFAQSNMALDMAELTTEDVRRLLDTLRLTGGYDYIIVDMDFSLEASCRGLYRGMDALVWVGDGTPASNNKTSRAYASLVILEQNEAAPLNEHLVLTYNKFSRHVGQQLEGVKVAGGCPRYEGASTEQIIQQMAGMDMFDDIL